MRDSIRRSWASTSTKWWLIPAVLAIGGIAAASADHSSAGRPEMTTDSASAWLVSAPAGFVGRANPLIPGPRIATTDRIGLPVAASAVTRRRGDLLIVEDPGRAATIVDLRTRTSSRVSLHGGEAVDAVGGRPWLIDPTAGRITLLPEGGVVAEAGGALGAWIVSDGAIWASVPATGAILRVGGDGLARTRSAVFPAGGRPMLAASPSGVALVDGSTLTMLAGSGVTGRHRLPGTPSKVAVAPDGTFAASLDGSVLSLVPLAGEAPPRSVDLRAGHRWGAMTVGGGLVYLTDDATGTLWPVGSSVRAPVPVAGHAAHLELFAQGGLVWANDPGGPNAVAVEPGGDTLSLIKYAPPKPTPKPTPTPAPSVTHTTTPPPTPTSRPPSVPKSAKPAPGPTKPKPGPTGSPAPPPARASFSNLHNGQEVGKCAPASGSASMPKTDTLLLAVRRTDPPGDYYFTYAASRNGNVKSFDTTVYFGDAADQSYRVHLLIMDVDDARQFYDSHAQQGGDYAVSSSLPARAKRADSASVRQTTTDCDQ
jgi:hypothetical protein